MGIVGKARDGVRRAGQPANLLWLCLTGLALFPLIASAMFYLASHAERSRAEEQSRVATLLLDLQDAEVDFSLARRSVQAYLRVDDPAELRAANELLAATRGKVAALHGESELRALEADVSAYRESAISALNRAARRRILAGTELRELGEQIDADIALYATRFERSGLAGLAADVAQARVTIAAAAPDAQGPDRLAASMRLPLDLADTAETGAPAARAIVRRIDERLGRFIERWRELLSLEDANAAAQLGARSRDISARFAIFTDRQHDELKTLRGAARDLGARLDLLLGLTVGFVVVLSAIAARAIWRLFADQRDRAKKEAKRRKGLEAALAQLDAAISARRAEGTAEITLKLPDPLPPPPTPKAEPAPTPATKADAPPAAPAKPSEPDTDELIKMLMSTLNAPPGAKK
ncbi:MAG: hypothetical protein LCH62_11465 [Proteobacteria bacterium]|nr:hypothetical protein [Pseudomonadota bacterium]